MDELQSRLERLAPPVDDVDDALAVVRVAGRRRRVRQRGVAAAAVAVVVMALISGIALAGSDGDDAAVFAADPDPTTVDRSERPGGRSRGTLAEPGTSVPAPDAPGADVGTAGPATTDPARRSPSSRPEVTAPVPGSDPDDEPAPLDNDTIRPAIEGDLAVRVTPDSPSVRVGERARFRLEVTNVASVPVSITGGGCSDVFDVAVVGPNGPSGIAQVPSWSPGSTTLLTYVATTDVALRPYPHPSAFGGADAACFMALHYFHLSPGEARSATFLYDAVVRPGSSVGPMTITAAVGTTSASAVVDVLDEPAAHASTDAFVGAAETHPAVQSWLDPRRSGQGFGVTLSYARGAFELRITSGIEVLRVRGTGSGTITDVRSFRLDMAPSDDPDAEPYVRDPDERMLFPI